MYPQPKQWSYKLFGGRLNHRQRKLEVGGDLFWVRCNISLGLCLAYESLGMEKGGRCEGYEAEG